MISGHEEFLFLAIRWAGYFFPFFSHKLSITFVLHAIFFFRQALTGIFFFKSPPPPPPQELNGRPLRHESVGIHVLFHNMFHIFFRKIHQLQNLSEQVCFCLFLSFLDFMFKCPKSYFSRNKKAAVVLSCQMRKTC